MGDLSGVMGRYGIGVVGGKGRRVARTISSPSLFQEQRRSVIGAFRNRFLATRPEKGKVIDSLRMETSTFSPRTRSFPSPAEGAVES
jgi:hypothetical protein